MKKAIYMEQPHAFEDKLKPKYVIKLRKSTIWIEMSITSTVWKDCKISCLQLLHCSTSGLKFVFEGQWCQDYNRAYLRSGSHNYWR